MKHCLEFRQPLLHIRCPFRIYCVIELAHRRLVVEGLGITQSHDVPSESLQSPTLKSIPSNIDFSDSNCSGFINK